MNVRLGWRSLLVASIRPLDFLGFLHGKGERSQGQNFCGWVFRSSRAQKMMSGMWEMGRMVGEGTQAATKGAVGCLRETFWGAAMMGDTGPRPKDLCFLGSVTARPRVGELRGMRYIDVRIDPIATQKVVRRARLAVRMNASGNTSGFVNCRRCGSDVAVEFSDFDSDECAEIKCPECGREWEAGFNEVDVLFQGKIQKATELLQQKKSGNPEAVMAVGKFRRSIKIWVGNLPARIGDEDLEALFKRYGEVRSARVIYDRNTSRSRGFAFVEMADEGEGRAAIQDLDGNRDLGAKIAVRKAQTA